MSTTTQKCEPSPDEEDEALDRVFFDINGDLLSYDDVVDRMLNAKDDERSRRIGRG